MTHCTSPDIIEVLSQRKPDKERIQGCKGFYKPLAWTKTFAIGASVIMAITLVPLLCTFLIKGKLRPMEDNFISRMLLRGYQPVLKWVIDHKKTFSAHHSHFSHLCSKKNRAGIYAPLDEGSILIMPVMLPIVNRIDMLATGIRTSVGVKIFGTDLNILQQLALDVEKALRNVPGAVDLYAERITGKPYLE